MEEVFGPITPFLINMVVALLTQYIKTNFTLDGKKVQFVALAFSAVFIVPYQLLLLGEITALGIYSAVVYSLLGWLSAIGLYEVASKIGR